MEAVWAEMGTVFPILAWQAGLVAAGPVPAGVAGHTEAVHRGTGLVLLAMAAAARAGEKELSAVRGHGHGLRKPREEGA